MPNESEIVYNVPEVTVFLSGKLLNDVTELLSADKWTGSGSVGVSECERSCIARPPCPTFDMPKKNLKFKKKKKKKKKIKIKIKIN